MRLIDADGSYTLNDADNTGYSLCFGGGIISVVNKDGHTVCDFYADDAHAVDVEPARHGYWVKTSRYVCGDYEFVCSLCGDSRWEWLGFPDRTHYCPNCGAKMDEV